MGIAEILADELRRFIKDDLGLALVVGLGNPQTHSDALGFRTVQNVLKTNGMMGVVLERGDGDKVRPVSTFIPGVMAETGIATADIVKAVCGRLNPSLVILVDSLCALKVDRLNTTIQISSNGISPGAAVAKSSKKVINSEFLGVPVITIGAPVVVDVIALARDITTFAMPVDSGDDDKDYETLEAFFNKAVKRKGTKKPRSARQVALEDFELEHVAPTNVVAMVGFFADIIAGGINLALHLPLPHKELFKNNLTV